MLWSLLHAKDESHKHVPARQQIVLLKILSYPDSMIEAKMAKTNTHIQHKHHVSSHNIAYLCRHFIQDWQDVLRMYLTWYRLCWQWQTTSLTWAATATTIIIVIIIHRRAIVIMDRNELHESNWSFQLSFCILFPIKFAKKLSLCDWYCFQWCTTWAELSSSSCHWTSGRINICNLFLCGSPIFWCLYDPAIRCPLVQETSTFLEEWHEAHLQPGHKLDKLSVSKRMRVGIGHRPGMIDKTLKRAEAFDTFGTCTCGAS